MFAVPRAKAYVSQSCTATLSVSMQFDQYNAVRLARLSTEVPLC